MNHLMIDIETLGLKPGAPILQIGAVAFDPVAGEIGEVVMDQKVDIISYDSFDVDPNTVAFWAMQDPILFQKMLLGTKSLGRLLEILYCYRDGFDHYWACDPDFDMKHLEHWFDYYNLAAPWKYNQCRSVRTAVEMTGVERVEPLQAHDALSDCEAQIKTVINAYKRITREVAS